MTSREMLIVLHLLMLGTFGYFIKAERINIQALFDYEKGLIFYKDESIPACFVDTFTNPESGLPILHIPVVFLNDTRKDVLRNLSGVGEIFCKSLPVLPFHARKLQKRRKRQTYGYFREVPGEARSYGSAHIPNNIFGQAQVQGQVFGNGLFSGQAQTQGGGMSQSQVQLSGVGIRGTISSSSGNALTQLSLGNGVGSGQASGLGVGPSNSQVQVTLGQGNEESMASASATSGGASAGISGGQGGYYRHESGSGLGEGVATNNVRNGYSPGSRYFHDASAPGTFSRSQYRDHEQQYPTQQSAYIPQGSQHDQVGSQNGNQLNGGYRQGSLPDYSSTSGTRRQFNGETGTSNTGSYPAGYHPGIGVTSTSGFRPGSGPAPASQQFINDYSSYGSSTGRGDQSINSHRAVPSSHGITENGFRKATGHSNGLHSTRRDYQDGRQGSPYAQSSTPGAYASSHGIGQAQAQTVYFGEGGYTHFRDSQPGSGRYAIDGSRYQDQSVGYTPGQQQTGGGSSASGDRGRYSGTGTTGASSAHQYPNQLPNFGRRQEVTTTPIPTSTSRVHPGYGIGYPPSGTTSSGYLPSSILTPPPDTGRRGATSSYIANRNGQSQHHSGTAKGQPYRINGHGQVTPAGPGRHSIAPTTTTITDTSAPDTSGQSGFFPSYGVSRVTPDDPNGSKCTIITFSCTIVIESNGRAKICKPNAVRVGGRHAGTPTGTNDAKICCC